LTDEHLIGGKEFEEVDEGAEGRVDKDI